jgi:hypothetical protein
MKIYLLFLLQQALNNQYNYTILKAAGRLRLWIWIFNF